MERVVLPAVSPFDPAVLGSAVLLLALVVLTVRYRRAAWPVAFGVAWFLIALLPVANVVPLTTFRVQPGGAL